MNSRNVLVIIAAILVPGGVLLLVPMLYRWLKQRKALRATASLSSIRGVLQPALPDRS